MAGQGLSSLSNFSCKTKTDLPWSRRRFSCLVCGLEKRWDNLINHYKVLVRFDNLESDTLESDVLTHSKYFVEKGITKDTLVTYIKLHTLPQEEEGNKQMKAELWTPGREVEEEAEKEVEETDSGGDQWHFQNALFDDIKSSLKGGKSSSSSSMSRRRYSCLACGEVKRWDQLTQHYKKLVQWDSMGIPAVPDQKGMGEKVYQHTALFFEKNFSRDKMPTYRDHVPADGGVMPPPAEEKPQAAPALKLDRLVDTGAAKIEVRQFEKTRLHSFMEQAASMAFPAIKGVGSNIFNGACGAFKEEVKEEIVNETDVDHEPEPSHSMDAIEDLVTVKDELMPMCNPSLFFSPFSLPPRLPLPLPLPQLPPKRARKRKLAPSSSITSNSPSQSRRFYKCLGCGSSKRWDRLTDHYRKYVVFGPLGQPWVPNLETMTPEQYVHTLAFRDQGFSSDRMPQYKDHAEASQDNDDEFGIVEDGQDSMTGYDDGQEFLAGQVQDSRDSFDATEESVETSKVANQPASEPTVRPEPVIPSQKLNHQQPNIKIFWDNKKFSDVKIICDGGEVIAHRLILAAKSTLFYQVLIDSADEEFSVILMPDHSFADVSAMVQDYYDFKTTENAFNIDDKVTTDQDDDGIKTSSNTSKMPKLQFPKKMEEKPKLPAFQSPTCVDITEPPDDDAEEMSALPTAANTDTLDSLILRAGSVLCPTYSCKVPGCQFSVQRSLLCIKGHILTEHWGSLG